MKYSFIKSLIISVTLLFFTSQTSFATEQKDYEHLLNSADKIKSSDPALFTQKLEELEISASSLNTHNLARFQYLKAYKKTFTGEIDSAISIASNIDFSESPVALQAEVDLFIANIAALKEDWILALSSLNKGIEYAEKSKNEVTLARSYITAAITFNLMNRHDLAFNFAKKLDSLPLDKRNSCVAKQVYIEAGLFTDKVNEYSFEVDNAINACEEINEFVWSNIIRLYVAKRLNQQEKHSDVIKGLIVHLDSIEDTKYLRLITGIYSELALAYQQSNKPEKALLYAQKVIENPQSLKYAEPLVVSYKVLYEIAQERQEHQQALLYFEKYHQADKAYMDTINAQAYAFQVVTQETQEKQNTIELLNKQNELLNNRNKLLQVEHTLTESEAKNNRLIAALSIAVAILVGFFGFRSWQTQKRLKLMAEYDYLTKVYNRGHFMVLAEETLKLASKSGQTVTCIIFDLDKFKKVNDTYGHHTGDWALKASVAAVKNCIRDHDILARLGGEEFVVLLPSCDLQAATFVAEKCIETLQQIDTQETGHQFTITASFGITTTTLSGYNVEQLTADADKALYSSKNNGRNQLTIYDNDLMLAELV